MNRSQTRIILLQSHTGIGITIAAFFYIALFFGTISMLGPYLGTWEKPSRHFSPVQKKAIDLDALISPLLECGDWPDSGIRVTLPGRRDPALSIGHRFIDPVYLHPVTGTVLRHEGRGLTRFLVNLHSGRVLGRTGVYIMGLGAVGVLFLGINGWWLILSHRDHSVSLWRWKTGAWLRWHRKLAQWLFPVLFILALTSTLFGVGFPFGGGLAYVASLGAKASTHAVLGPVIFSPKNKLTPSGQKAKMASLNQLYRKACNDFTAVDIQTIGLDHWGDKNAVITFSGPLKKRRWLTERINRLSITYRATDGGLLMKEEIGNVHWVKKLLSGFYFFHFLTDAGPFVRWLMFFCGFGLCIGVGAPVLAWIWKRPDRKRGGWRYFVWSRIFITFFWGLLPATAILFLLHWLLPQDLAERMVWLKGIFYLIWQSTLIWTIVQENDRKAAGSLLIAAGACLCAAPVVHGFSTGFFFWTSFAAGLSVVAWVDMGLMCAGGLCLWCGLKLYAPLITITLGNRI